MSNQLMPCPFCGSEDLIQEATVSLEIHGACHQTCWIECNKCGTQGPNIRVTDETDHQFLKHYTNNNIPYSNDYQAVRDAWNNRDTLIKKRQDVASEQVVKNAG